MKIDPAGEPKRGSVLQLWFVLAVLLVIGLHVWATVNPAHANWGVHLFAFYPSWADAMLLAVALTTLVPQINSRLLLWIRHGLAQASSLPMTLRFVLVSSLLLAVIALLPVRLHLLGDGAVLLRSNAMVEWGNDLRASFANQPLMRFIYRGVLSLHLPGSTPSPHDIYLWIDIGSGIAFIGLLLWFFRVSDMEPVDGFLLALMFFFTASTEFFFGYVENYVLQFVIVTYFLLSGWRAIEGKTPFLIPLVCFIILGGLHLGYLILSPALLYLLLRAFRGRRPVALAIAASLAAGGVALLLLVGYDIRGFLRHLSTGSVDFLQPFTAAGGNFPYPMFSLRHLWDWADASLLVAPFAVILTIGLFIQARQTLSRRDPVFVFLLLATACGALFTWIVNFALGMARDWDLFSTFIMPLVILDAYLFLHIDQAARRAMLAVIVVLAGIHWGAWIGINASAEKHLARMKLLDEPAFLSLTSQMVYDEALANYFFDSANYVDARTYYERIMSIDRNNPRIVGNMADTYRRLGEKDLYFKMLLHAVDLKSRDPGIYSNLGVEYALRGDTAQAIAFNEMALTCDSSYRLALANLGILYGTKHDFLRAESYLSSAIDRGMREPSLFRYAGDICALNGSYSRALQFYNSYLVMVPGDPAVVAARDRIRTYLQQSGPPTE